MKQREAVKAYLAVKDLNKQKMSSGRTAKKIFDLYCILQKYWEFQGQEEIKVNQRYPNLDFEKGSVNMEGMSPEERAKTLETVASVNRELNQIGETEIDLVPEKFVIEFDEEPNLKISGEDIGALEKFIEFK